MSKLVIYRDRQEIVPDDLNRSQQFLLDDIERRFKDSITALRYFTGFGVTKTGQAEITVDPGFFYTSGLQYERLSSQVYDVFNYLPVVTRKIVAVVTWGNTQEVDQQPRDYLIDVDNETVEPQAVSMQTLRYANLAIVQGAESAAPQKPTIDGTTIAVAWVTLDINGVVSIEMADANKLPSVQALNDILAEMALWRRQIEQAIDTLRSEIMKLRSMIPQDPWPAIREIVARLRMLETEHRCPQPSTPGDPPPWVSVDRFVNLSDFDVAATGYAADVAFGLRFPGNAETRAGIALLNPLEPKVATSGNITTPVSTNKVRFRTGSITAGSLSVSQYTTQTIEMVRKLLTRNVVTTVANFTVDVSSNWSFHEGFWWGYTFGGQNDGVNDKLYDDNTGLFSLPDGNFTEHFDYSEVVGRQYQMPDHGQFRIKRAGSEIDTWNFMAHYEGGVVLWNGQGERPKVKFYSVWRSQQAVVEEPYWEAATVTTTVNAAGIGQTWLATSSGWVKQIGVHFNQKAASGNVTLLLTEVNNQKPDQSKVIGQVTVAAADLVSLPGSDNEVLFPINPTFVQAGRRYAVCLLTQGNHLIATVPDNSYSQGQLYYLSDTGMWTSVNLSESADIRMNVYYATFENTRVEVGLVPIQHAGGISKLSVMAAMHIPEGCDLSFEVQVGGVWMPLICGENLNPLGLYPALLAFRMVFSGTQDLMPGIDLTQSEVTATRFQNTLTHFSKDHNPPAATTDVEVKYYCTGFHPAHHALTCSLRRDVGNTVAAATAHDVVYDPQDPHKTVHRFTFAAIDSTDYYDIKTVATTDQEGNTFVVDQRWDTAQQ